MPTWTRPQVRESISVQKWNSLHGRQVHYTDITEGHQMNGGGLQLSRSDLSVAVWWSAGVSRGQLGSTTGQLGSVGQPLVRWDQPGSVSGHGSAIGQPVVAKGTKEFLHASCDS